MAFAVDIGLRRAQDYDREVVLSETSLERSLHAAGYLEIRVSF